MFNPRSGGRAVAVNRAEFQAFGSDGIWGASRCRGLNKSQSLFNRLERLAQIAEFQKTAGLTKSDRDK